MAVDGSLIFGTEIDGKGFEDGVSSIKQIANITLGNIGADMVQQISSALADVPKKAIEVGASFESSMSQVAATMGITDTAEEFEMLSEAAKELGESTKYSASQAGESLNYLALAGMNAEEAVSALPTVLNVAAAGGMELAAASDLITDAMSALGLELSDMNTFADELAVTAQKSNTSVSQLGEAILTVGGTAKTLSSGVVEMNTALGILADNGIKGAEGGTALRNVILSLSAPTDKAAEALARLEVDAFDEAGKMRPLQDTIADLNEALSSMSDQEKTAVLNEIFNKVDLKAVNALLGTSADRFDELSGYISDCDGAAAQMAETMDDNLNGDLTIMQSALEGLGIAAYEKFQEPMRTAVQNVTGDIGKLTSSLTDGELSEKFDNLSESVSDLVSDVSGLLADDVLPAAIDALSWVIDNGDTIVTVVMEAAAAVTAYRLATEGAAAAQQLLSAAASANSYALIVAGAAAATIAVSSYLDEMGKNLINKTAIDETTQAIYDQTAAYNVGISEARTNMALADANAEATSHYWEAVQDLVDENGNAITSVSELETAVARLNEVSGQNIQVIDGQIQGYQELSESFDDFIENTRNSAKLAALQPSYGEALLNYDQKAYDDAQKASFEANNEWKRLQNMLNKALKTGTTVGTGWGGSIDSLAEATDKAYEEASRANTEYGAIAQQMEGYKAIIDEYEGILEDSNSIGSSNQITDGSYLNGQDIARKNKEQHLDPSESESFDDLKNEWAALDHEYSMGIIADDTELYRRRKELLEKYGDESNSDHWSYYEKLHDMEQDFADEQVKLAEDTAQKQKQSIQDEWDNIGRQRDNGFLTPEEAYKKQLEWIQKYCPEYSAEWDSYYQEVISYEQNARKEQLNGVKESLSDTLDEYKKAYSELETSAKSYKNKLLSVGDLFAITTEKDENGNEKKIYSVENLREQMNEMRKYHNYVKDLISQGASQGLISELTSMDFDDSKIFAENLSKMSGAEFNQINSLYKERDELADELANEIFEPQKEKLNKELAESILNELGVIPENIKVIGTEALEAFIEGISESGNLTEGTTKFIDEFFTACMEGLNSSNINSALADELSTAFGEQDTYSMGKEKGEDFAAGFNEALDQIYTQFDIERANVTASVTSSGQPVQPAAQSSGSLAGSSKNTEKIQINTTVELDGEKIGKASYEYSQNYSRRTDK